MRYTLPTLLLSAALGLGAAQLPSHAQSAYSLTWVFDGPGCSTQPAPPGACLDEPTLHGLLRWTAERMGTPLPAVLPPLAILGRDALANRLCPEAPAECNGVMAGFEPSTGTVMLRDFLDMRRAPDRSFVVHELVHVLQHRQQGAGFQVRCSDVMASEAQAYQLQNQFLHTNRLPQRVGQMVAQMFCPTESGEPVVRTSRMAGERGFPAGR